MEYRMRWIDIFPEGRLRKYVYALMHKKNHRNPLIRQQLKSRVRQKPWMSDNEKLYRNLTTGV